MAMLYADITRNDKNPIKRFLQRKRLQDALGFAQGRGTALKILDYGAGDGELSRLIACRDSQAQIFCYEPCDFLRDQAAENTRGLANVTVVDNVEQQPEESFDVIFCTEVFEHLPPHETEDSLRRIQRLLRSSGVGVIGVPIEIGLPALFNGLFRIARRFGEFDALPINVLRASVGSPPRKRPVTEISPGLRYHPNHMGFDHRRLHDQLHPHFHVVGNVGSPWQPLGRLLNSELYFLVEKRRAA